jgi:hypothetical protein
MKNKYLFVDFLTDTDLARMYDLVIKIPDGLSELKRLLEQHIYNQGMEAIKKNSEAVLNVFFAYEKKCSKSLFNLKKLF